MTDRRAEMKVHAIAGLAPPMSADEYADLAADVAANGLIVPIVTWHGDLVDGRHRLRACDDAGIEPRFDALPDDWDEPRVLLHVLSLHKRRNLDVSQRAMMGARAKAMLDVLSAAAAGRKRVGQREGGSVTARLAAAGQLSSHVGVKPPAARPLRYADLPAVDDTDDDLEDDDADLEYAAAADDAEAPQPDAAARLAREAAAQAADLVGVGRSTMHRAITVERAASAGNAVAVEARRRIDAGVLSVAQADRIVRAPVEHQAAMLAQLDTAERSADAGDSWGTPPEWIAFARTVMGGIDLDPASNDEAQRTVQAARYYTAKDDGLAQEWSGRVWLNPPYSQPLVQRFAEKLLVEIDAGRCTQAVVLVNNVTDTRTGQTLLGACNAVLFPRGRVPFVAPGGAALTGARQGQMVLYFGPRAKAFAAAGRGLGWVGVAL